MNIKRIQILSDAENDFDEGREQVASSLDVTQWNRE